MNEELSDRAASRPRVVVVIEDVPLFSGNGPEKTRSVDVLSILTELATRKMFIAKSTVAFFLAGILISFLLPIRYAASTVILPPQQNQSTAAALMAQLSSTGLAGLTGAAGRELGLKNPSDLYIGILKTRSIGDALIEKFRLKSVYNSKDMTGAREVLADRTKIEATPEGLIFITVLDSSKERAADLANTYVQELRSVTDKLAVTEASHRRLFYERQLLQAKDDLANAEISMKELQQKHGVIQLDAQAKAVIGGVAALRAQIAERNVELKGMSAFATANNPQVQVVQTQVAALQAELGAMLQQSSSSDPYNVSLKELPAAGVEYIRRARDLKYRELLFELMARQYEMARVDESGKSALVQIVEPAIQPDRRHSPKRVLIVLVMGLCGMLFGCVITMARHAYRQATVDESRANRLRSLRETIFSRCR